MHLGTLTFHYIDTSAHGILMSLQYTDTSVHLTYTSVHDTSVHDTMWWIFPSKCSK